MKIYISGPISGLEESVYRMNFARAADLIENHGHEPVNPLDVEACLYHQCNGNAVKIDGSYLHSWQCYMKHDLVEMLKCEGILMIPGWVSSRGAHLEISTAIACGLEVFESSNYGIIRKMG